MIKTLSIDLETRSACDLKKTGVYRYSEDSSFRILLFGVSINGAPPIVYDIATGDTLPDDLLHALVSKVVVKWAFNASFERVCISNWLRKNYPDIFQGYGIPMTTFKTIWIRHPGDVPLFCVPTMASRFLLIWQAAFLASTSRS